MISVAIGLLLLPLGKFMLSWLIWGLVLLIFGRRHPMVYDNSELDPGRRKLALLALAVFLLCFTLVPVGTGGL